ncbi:MAG: FlgD immunoglobulin-like domain containing protein [candidate division WOR-3 bacterium]
MVRTICTALIVMAFMVTADAQTYSLWNKVLDDGGTVATSSNYNLKASFAQSTIGVISNSSYTANIGYFGVYWGWYWTTGIEEQESKSAGIVTTFFLAPSSPNPFHSFTKIKYGLARSCALSLKIYNIAGQCVRTLVSAKQNAGDYEISWNGKDDNQRELSQGIYFLRMETDGYTETKKMVLLH